MGYYLHTIDGQSVAFTTRSLYDSYFAGNHDRIAKVKSILANGRLITPNNGTVVIDGYNCYHAHLTNNDGIAWRWNTHGLYVAAYGTKGGRGSGNYDWRTS